jgi:hypothetical protein
MFEFELNGETYQLTKLSAMTQFHVSRRVVPIMAALDGGGDTIAKLMGAVSNLSDEDAEYVIGKCLADCRRKSGETWAKVFVGGNLMFEDIGMPGMIKLTFETLRENLTGFFTGLPSGSGQKLS